MKKSFLYRWFGIGKCPKKVRFAIDSEGILVFDEGMSGQFITKHVDGPWIRYRNRSEGFLGSLAITSRRILCYTFSKKQINIATDDKNIQNLSFIQDNPTSLTICFESSKFREFWQGEIMFQFNTEKADEFMRIFNQKLAQLGR